MLLKVLIEKQNQVVVFVRNSNQIDNPNENYLELKHAEVTKPETLRDICEGIDTVISTVGITKQKDDLTYMDVDYQANINLLAEAKNIVGIKF
ncbi:NAD(P)H-binding protein [Mesoflavibacter zeaxanthinifaciens]|uniref:NAD(P)H-binding protein n=1 Tax=Mesoflavibacter zeaxanthinifaciens TaxID=393060 RepID=UPI0026F000D1|nr:NAD(P)H-binding protein [Mesoflavibacter zeaxanthinifaciens]